MSKHRSFKGSDLERVRKVSEIPGTSGELFLGDQVQLNSGSPTMLVVDVSADTVIAASADGSEHALPRVCVRRLSACASSASAETARRDAGKPD